MRSAEERRPSPGVWRLGRYPVRLLPWLVTNRTAAQLWRSVALPTGGVVALALLVTVGFGAGMLATDRSEASHLPISPTDLMILTTALVVVGMAASVGGTWRALRRPASALLTLDASVRQAVVTGDLQPTAVSRRDEIGQVCHSFNQLVDAFLARRQHQAMLIADARHELRTPLTSLRTNVELLALDHSGHFLRDAVRAEILDDITKQVVEFSTLINGLVWLEDDPVMTGREEPLDVSIVVGDALRRARRRGQGLQFDVHTSPFPTVGDPVMLERAIVNLLDNAIKYSPPDGTVTVRLSGNQLQISDEGPGISAVDLPHIFDRYYRSASNPDHLPGTGIGLAIVHDTVEQHRATIRADNLPNGGTEFCISFPSVSADRPILS